MSEHLDKFLTGEYVNYKYGNPELAAKILKTALHIIEESIQTAKDQAGDFLAPGIVSAFKKDLAQVINK